MRSKSAVKWLILIWVVDFLLLLLLPFGSQYGNEIICFCLSLIFLLQMVMSGFIMSSYFEKRPFRIGKAKKNIPVKIINKSISLFSCLSICGIILILYDRIFIRGIDYSQGLRNARYQWINSQGGSLSSIAGNLLVPLSYCALFFSIYHWEDLKKFRRLTGALVGVGIPVTQALINGGRSNILIAAFFVLATLVCRQTTGKNFFPQSKGMWLIGAGTMIVMFVAVFGVFLSSAAGIGLKNYTIALVEMNGGKVSNEYLNGNDNILQNVIMLFSSYLFHGQWRFGQIVNIPFFERPGDDILLPFMIMLKRFHLYSGEAINPPMIAGNFLNVPGGFYYDFDLIGILFGSLFLGTMLGLAISFLKRRSSMGGLRLSFVIASLMIVFSTPICNMFGFAYFVFVIYALIAGDIAIRLLWGRYSWMKLEMFK